ncbi:MAG: hypothetical protein KDI79_04365 [Anaerolineae bacterium]|nr:hypothetical protein [Anaerolineae bacterium]
MNLSVMKLPNQQPQFFAQCPVTGKRIAVQELREFDLINQHAMWWRCTECSGWHIDLKQDEVENAVVAEVVGVT